MKRILIFCLLLLLCTTTFAQEKRKFTFGLHLSPSIDWMKPNSLEYTSEGSIIGFTWGAFCEINGSDNYCLATAIDFRSTGGQLKYPDQENINGVDKIGSMSRDYHVKYLEVPLAIKMSTNEIAGLFFWGKFGLGNAIKISANSDDEFTTSDGNVYKTSNKNIISSISTFKESLIIGLGCEYRISGSTKIIAGFTFNNGFSDVLNGTNNKDNSISEKATVNQLELNIGIVF